MPRLTIGMACHDDFHGVAFSVQSLALHHDLTDCEVLVVDNSPTSSHGQMTRQFCMQLANRNPGPVRYIPMAEKVGTTQTRERIFAEASGQAVLVMDCHVLYPSRTIDRLKSFYESNPDCQDILSGPLMLNHFQNFHTHFNDQWRGAMWGTWATAWKCTCSQPLLFTTLELGPSVVYRDLATSRTEVSSCANCGRILPQVPWAGHEAHLVQHGFQPLGFSDSDPAFEIPGQGLGVFTCRKEAWPGFNPHFRGFGGEELYIHTKFRQRGGRALCLPWLKWWHRFERPDGVRYPLSLYLKVRNYVLGHQELGLDIEPVYRHFVSLEVPDGQSLREHLLYEHSANPKDLEGKSEAQLAEIHRTYKLSEAEWQFLLSDPIGHISLQAPTPVEIQLETGRPQPPAGVSLDQIFEWCRSVPRDLDQHLPLLKDLASKCEHVTEITKRRESTVGLLAGRPAVLISYQKEQDILLKTLSEAITADAQSREGQRRVERHTIHWGVDSVSMNSIEPTDLLFLDSVMSAERLSLELAQHAAQVRRFLVVRGTGAFGERAEGIDAPGLFHALRPFVAKHAEWFVTYHTNTEYGITVLSRNPADRPAQPIHAWPPGFGPGTELAAILASLGINPDPTCDCKGKAIQMDLWGVARCRENREQIIAWMREGQGRWGWQDKLAAAAKAVSTGLAFKLDWFDPFPSLIDEAIRRAEVREQERLK